MLECNDDRRREAARARQGWNGLDYVEVDNAQTTLTAYFLGKTPKGVKANNVVIEGGRGPHDALRVTGVEVQAQADPRLDDRMLVRVDRPGDYSTYTLRLVGLEGIDPRYDRVDFSFKINCPSDLDCAAGPPCPPDAPDEPEIDYLAKDYGTFRQLILDRLSLIMPDWKERHVPDLGIALVEVLAYAGDYLSYYQDAVATEAYLDTARRRPSVRRHARLVDYVLSEGCNARALVCLETERNLTLKAGEFYFVTGLNDALPIGDRATLRAYELGRLAPDTYEVFEPARRDADVRLYKANNRLRFYTWGDRECCLEKGSTRATLRGELAKASQEPPPTPPAPPADQPPSYALAQTDAVPDDEETLKVRLRAGDILVFEEVIGPRTGNAADADPLHRHAVRVTQVTQSKDELLDEVVIEIEWGEEDALPFDLCLSAIGPAPNCEYLDDISVARGNVVLVDHGRTLPPESLGTVPLKQSEITCDCEGHPSEIVNTPGRYRPRLQNAPLTFRQPLPADGAAPSGIRSAATVLAQDPRMALPQVWLDSIPPRVDGTAPLFIWDNLSDATGLAQALAAAEFDPNAPRTQLPLSRRTRRLLDEFKRAGKPDDPLPAGLVESVANDIARFVGAWSARGDLLSSGSGDQHFVVEMEQDGTANLRFGDGELGERPAAGTAFRARYRVGNGTRGNVGAGAICILVHAASDLSNDVKRIWNPMPAQGGSNPEPMAEAKLNAPYAFRAGTAALQRAITADDYAHKA
jgi:hypothetical protein